MALRCKIVAFDIRVICMRIMVQLILDENKAWGEATTCALVEALESGKGMSLKEISMNGTGLGSDGCQRISQAIQHGSVTGRN